MEKITILNRPHIIPAALRILGTFWNSALEFNSNIFVLTFVNGSEVLSLDVLFSNLQIDGQVGNRALKFKQD